MKIVLVAAAVLGFSAASASAECSYHSAQAKTDTMTTASVASTDQPNMTTVDQTSEKATLPQEE